MSGNSLHLNEFNQKHRTWLAVLLSLCLAFVLLFTYSNIYAATDEEDHPPTVSDWGIFDLSTNTEKSMKSNSTIKQDSEGLTLYVRFNHNVAGEQLLSNNLSKIAVISNDGRPVEADVWAKSTVAEFEYRQYIFITLSNNINPDKGYQIVIAPGMKANNTYVNENGNSLYFTYAGTSGERPQQSVDQEEQQATQPTQATQATQATQSQTSTRRDSSQSGSSSAASGSSTNKRGTAASSNGTANRQQISAANTGRIMTNNNVQAVHNRRVQKLSESVALALSGKTASAETASVETAQSGHEGNPYILVVVLLFIAIIESGILAELISFNRSLIKRRKVT